MEIKKISIIGLGALGVMYGNYINERVPKGSLRIVADNARLQKYKSQGIYCNGKLCDFTYITPEAEDPADLLIFAVKFGQLEEAIQTAARQVGDNTIILSTLNGITSEEYLAKAFHKDRVLLCTVQGMDSVKIGNQMEYHNFGTFSIGTWEDTITPSLRAVTAFFDQIGLPYEIPSDMKRQLWNKLMLNVGINQAITVYETNYGGIQREGEPREIMLQAMKEVVMVAQAMKINLKEEDIRSWDQVIGRLNPEGMPSMRQDALAHRPTEVELFSGTIIRLGNQYHIPTPVNAMLYRRIKELVKASDTSMQ